MSKKISAIDSERIFAQDIGLQIFFEAPRSSKLRPSEGNSLYAWTGFRALRNLLKEKGAGHSHGWIKKKRKLKCFD